MIKRVSKPHNPYHEYIYHQELNKDIAELERLAFEFPDLLKNARFKFVMQSGWEPKHKKFSLIFWEVYDKTTKKFLWLDNIDLHVYFSGTPEGWEKKEFKNIDLTFWYYPNDSREKSNIVINNQNYYRAGEDWANDDDGISGWNNWYDFIKQFQSYGGGATLSFKSLTLWIKDSIWYFVIPVSWEAMTDVKKVKND